MKRILLLSGSVDSSVGVWLDDDALLLSKVIDGFLVVLLGDVGRLVTIGLYVRDVKVPFSGGLVVPNTHVSTRVVLDELRVALHEVGDVPGVQISLDHDLMTRVRRHCEAGLGVVAGHRRGHEKGPRGPVHDTAVDGGLLSSRSASPSLGSSAPGSEHR